MNDIVRSSEPRANILVKEAANIKYSAAQFRLARMYYHNIGAEDQHIADFYSTLAYSWLNGLVILKPITA